MSVGQAADLASALPTGFVVRLHDDVVMGPVVRRGTRVLRLSATARGLMTSRSLTVLDPVGAVLAGRLLDLDLAVPVLAGHAVDVAALTDLTVVVPVRDRTSGVDRLLASLRPAVRCIVVDDASRDSRALAEVVARHGAELVRRNVNGGPSAARNDGLRRVSTPLVAFVDSDVEVTPHALAGLVAHTTDPGLAAVAARVRSRGGRRWFERYEDARGSLDLGPVPATVRPWSSVSYVPTACLVARVAALGDGFDEAMTSGEDVDLVWRLRGAGWRVRHAGDVVAWHRGRTTLTAWAGRKAFYGTSAAALSRRHGELVTPAVLTPEAAALIGAALVQRRWSTALAVAVVARMLAAAPDDLSPVGRVAVVAGSVRTTSGQASALALRHWWPIAAAACATSRRARRLVAVAAVADAALARARADTTLDPVRFAAARRLDDLAYGAGVWLGAARDRSARCLVPQWIRSP
ncbi:mycofactocin biosynthesis glycosyltransferase MftF [Aeromicrobium endophyticum]|uniref:Mycofactocin system glycosyltransferase n=1 Tax=Aeromicrobium endophyticum TaxID=2292704 RepID=A0A371PCK6_9ACTN|nr:mycofactocin biosynthesis glycosyltransferase MftF [Aeromicrobium endophyticum]REK73268.1 mycofactocin system glycosyltransferase [Aeromicrobium endophyticum]